MRVQLITDLKRLDSVWYEWKRLYTSIGWTPFQNPELHRIWWKHRGLANGWAPLIAIAVDEGRVVGVGSFAVKWQRGLRIMEWAGIEAFDYPTLLVGTDDDPSIAGEAAAEIWRALCRRGPFNIAKLRSTPATNCLAIRLSHFAQQFDPDVLTYGIDLTTHASGEAWLGALESATRGWYRKRLRMLEKKGAIVLRTVTDPTEIRSTVAMIVRWKAEWSRQRGTETVYLADGITEYLEAFAEVAHNDKMLHMTVLECGGVPICAALNLLGIDGLYYYVSAYDLTMSKASPGSVLMMMLIISAIDAGVQRFDFLRGEAAYKTELATTTRVLEDRVFAHGLVGRLALVAHRYQGQKAHVRKGVR